MAGTNPWAGVTPMKPNDAQYELQFLLIDLADDNGDVDSEEYFQKVCELFDQVYLAGWQDRHEAAIKETAQIIMEGIEYFGNSGEVESATDPGVSGGADEG